MSYNKTWSKTKTPSKRAAVRAGVTWRHWRLQPIAMEHFSSSGWYSAILDIHHTPATSNCKFWIILTLSSLRLVGQIVSMELENIVANTVYLKAREGKGLNANAPKSLPSLFQFHRPADTSHCFSILTVTESVLGLVPQYYSSALGTHISVCILLLLCLLCLYHVTVVYCSVILQDLPFCWPLCLGTSPYKQRQIYNYILSHAGSERACQMLQTAHHQFITSY